MRADCRATGRNLHLPRLERAARAAVEPAPSIHFEDFPREVPKRDIGSATPPPGSPTRCTSTWTDAVRTQTAPVGTGAAVGSGDDGLDRSRRDSS